MLNECFCDIAKLLLARRRKVPLERGVSDQEPSTSDRARYSHELKFEHANLATGLRKMRHHSTLFVSF
ncbi:hypothetical protein GCM10011609_71470 [Lentzea pudingi]|uniref:Tn3 transposase DDE domain-containing protein n=1 Tax=Lentzea pudingi TaxID=1789439 RepID=A0ABQ2IM67_9PSEU|nr:hypothetical protein [Lentzea pudingi]GGN20001.1 hypothetical protein GCM10011609_71470 [Lentzea pudingi]